MTGFRVAGIGGALPSGVLSNADLEARLDTSDNWIRERTGILERRVGGTTSGLGAEAARAALAQAPADTAAVGMLIVATSTPARLLPGAATGGARELGLTCGAIDVNGACAGFVYALQAATGFLDASLGSVLVIGADILSQVTDPDDRGTAILFGDGAGALLLAPGGEGGVLGFHAGTDPGAEEILYCDHGGVMKMEGRAVFRLAVRAASDSVRRALESADLAPGDVDLFVPHQANQRITDAIASRLGLEPERVVSTIARTGNSSAASIPYALAVAAADGRLHAGDIVLLSGFGAGMTWASSVIRWA